MSSRNLSSAQFGFSHAEDDEQHHITAHQNGRVVGEVHIDHEYGFGTPDDVPTVQALHVDPEHRGKGIASALMDEARRKKGDRLRYATGKDLPDGPHFLRGYARKTGWTPVGHDPEQYR